MAKSKTSYDEIPYRSNPFPQTRPERFAGIAKLFGLDTPPVENSRVLELGCSSGGNLIAMAQDFPNAHFIGIDLSARQIADGWVDVDSAKLKNVQLKHMDILDIDDEFGQFDYIISHGVFSWVPPAVQDRMIELCRRHLAPNGVAYLSYNTYPGWHIRGIVRDMMYFRGQQFNEPKMRLAQAKALVEFVANATKNQNTPYKNLIQSELEVVTKRDDYYLHHEHLEEHNMPLYFWQFAQKLAVNGLQYLAEADFASMVSSNFAPEVAQTLQKLGAHDILQMEQYMDFVRCRFFRQTLLCHRSVQLKRQISPEVVKSFYLSSQATPANAQPSLDPATIEKFKTPAGGGINCRYPLTKLALMSLSKQWPASIAFSDLLAEAKAQAAAQGVKIDASTSDGLLAAEMLSCMAAGVVEWRLQPATFTIVPDERPLATPLARHQAGLSRNVTNRRGENTVLDDFHRLLLRHLDGSRALPELIEIVATALKEGKLVLRRDKDNTPIANEAEIRQVLGPALNKAMQNLGRHALLVRT